MSRSLVACTPTVAGKMKTLALTVALLGCVVGVSEVAQAQSKCDAGKLKEYGKKVFCLEKVDSKAAKTGEPVDAAKEQKCIDKFAEKCAKAEAKADCTSAVKDCTELESEADTCRDAAPFQCPEDGTAEACNAWFSDVPCYNCCNAFGPGCDDTCTFAAISYSCINTTYNTQCAQALNTAGCQSVCCP